MRTYKLFLLLSMLFVQAQLFSQDEQPPAQQGPSAEELAKANNPLASIKALNFQNYYIPRLSGDPDATANSTIMRIAIPTGPILWRASVPLNTFNIPSANLDQSGLADIDLFAAYLAVSKPTFTFGIGPQFVFPSGQSRELTSARWGVGLAAVVFAAVNPKFQIGGLVTYRYGVGGWTDTESSLLAIQYFYFVQFGKGLYSGAAPIMAFNISNDNRSYNVPIGFRLGKVAKVGRTVFNFFVEPQYTVLHVGPAQPLVQVYASLNMQFQPKPNN